MTSSLYSLVGLTLLAAILIDFFIIPFFNPPFPSLISPSSSNEYSYQPELKSSVLCLSTLPSSSWTISTFLPDFVVKTSFPPSFETLLFLAFLSLPVETLLVFLTHYFLNPPLPSGISSSTSYSISTSSLPPLVDVLIYDLLTLLVFFTISFLYPPLPSETVISSSTSTSKLFSSTSSSSPVYLVLIFPRPYSPSSFVS